MVSNKQPTKPSRGQETRRRVLAAARRLLEGGAVDVSMSAIAAEAGVTRQLLYHHFAGRGDLLLQMAADVDLQARAPGQAQVDDAVDARSALREAIALQGRIKPQIDAVAAAIDRLRETDAEAQDVWSQRESARLSRVRDVVQRLADEGRLAGLWSLEDAAVIVWSMTSQRAWREHVVEQGWTTDRWVTVTTAAAERMLLLDPAGTSGPLQPQ